LKSHHGGWRQGASPKGLRGTVFISAELHRSRKSASLRAGVYNVLILLANSEASKFRLAFHFFEGTEAWKKLGGNLGFIVVK
jgi:hypothetical protein